MCVGLIDGVLAARRQSFYLPNRTISDVRVSRQLHTQVEAPAKEIHDEQRVGELHHPPGLSLIFSLCSVLD